MPMMQHIQATRSFSLVPLINLTIQHHQTQEEARRRLETAVHELSAKFGVMLRRVECNRP
jgi:hypothetical protein